MEMSSNIANRETKLLLWNFKLKLIDRCTVLQDYHNINLCEILSPKRKH